MLIANKCDLAHDMVVQPEVGKALAKEFNMAFFETSAKTGQNIQETFFHLAKAVKDKRDAEAERVKGLGGSADLGGGAMVVQRERGVTLSGKGGDKKEKKKGKCC